MTGLKWLWTNISKGFGACMADDMGLGKTIQVISLILKMKEENKLDKPVLVVCPTTLMGNWMKELQMFAPSLDAVIYHGIFTMAAKFYHPLFSWDPSEISFAAVTILLAITGSLFIAKMMEKTKLAYLFGKGKLLR